MPPPQTRATSRAPSCRQRMGQSLPRKRITPDAVVIIENIIRRTGARQERSSCGRKSSAAKSAGSESRSGFPHVLKCCGGAAADAAPLRNCESAVDRDYGMAVNRDDEFTVKAWVSLALPNCVGRRREPLTQAGGDSRRKKSAQAQASGVNPRRIPRGPSDQIVLSLAKLMVACIGKTP